MCLLNVHSELFLLNKSLIRPVFIYAIREIYTKLFELFSNIPQFGTNSSVQTHVDMFCLKETFKIYANDGSKEIIQKIIRLIPTEAFEQNKSLMTKIINDFQHDMQPYIAVFQQQPPTTSVADINQTDESGDTISKGIKGIHSKKNVDPPQKNDEIIL